MKTAVVTVTKQGVLLAERLKAFLQIEVYCKENGELFDLSSIGRRVMEEFEAVIFITSTGIAVRAIAPYLKNKMEDPAVLVIDITGNYVISLLSGHLGGANQLAAKIAKKINATPIITTATDNLGKIAPDVVAKNHDLLIDDMKKAKEIAALLIEGKKVGFIDETGRIPIPTGYYTALEGNLSSLAGIVCITDKVKPKIAEIYQKPILKLLPKALVLGIGCKKNYPPEQMELRVKEVLLQNNLDIRCVKSIATVEVKKEESAILQLARSLSAELNIFSLREISTVQDAYAGSDFVEKHIGVRAVAEPVVNLSGATFLTSKVSLGGMTLCIGRKEGL